MEVEEAAPRYVTRTDAQGVPPGYKRTEIGAIPEDWTAKPIRDFAPLQRGFDLPTSRIRPGSHPVVYSNGVLQHHDHAMVKGPGVVTGRSGTIGKVHFVEHDYWPHNTTLWVTTFRGNDPRFVYYIYAQVNLARFLSGSGVPTLNRNDVHQHYVAVPPPPEQRAIAEALSDVDGLLGALEALIAKKRAIKQAAMQQLLTGKTRLPGFSGEWETKQLGRCGSTYGGITGKGKADFGHGAARYVTFLNVLENATVQPALFEAVDIGSAETQNRVRRGDVLFNGTSETPEDVALGACVLDDWEDLYLNSFCFGFRFHSDTDHDPLFFAYFFRGPPGRQLMSALAQGATRYNMSKRQFLRLECALPDGDEQRAIAKVLSDMDAEIAALEARRDKTRAVKQGMMQQLLTGRVRLVKPEAAPAC